MPVIHQKPWSPDTSKHPRLTAELAAELRADRAFGQPLILVHKYSRSGLIAVTVIWDKWGSKDGLDRAGVILTSYGRVYGEEEREKVMVPLGYTEPEAVDSGLLPYAVVPLLRKTDPPELWDGCRKAMLDLGASDLWKKGHPRLRLPTEELAQRYADELTKRVPGSEGVWSVTQDRTYPTGE